MSMEVPDWNPKKPYDLRERLFEFACLIIRLVQFLHTRGPIAIELSAQVLKSGTSAAANYEEADDGTGKRDEIAKKKIALRELKETRVRLRMLRECNILASTIPSSMRATNLFVSSQPSSEKRKSNRSQVK